ncbi:MAG: hypothetical protein LRY71_17585 [Bacillaceae bacterium]|nr:hypothetical protein [Bacillaceae bacterium]
MQVIISHMNLDFDGLASMVAAKKTLSKGKDHFAHETNEIRSEIFGHIPRSSFIASSEENKLGVC